MSSLIPSLIASALGVIGVLVCLLVLRKHRVAAEQSEVALRSELTSMLSVHKVYCSEQIAGFGRNVAVLEPGEQSPDQAARGGLTRSARSQAMQLLRSGMSPENAAATLGIGRREMHLIASVSRTLSLK